MSKTKERKSLGRGLSALIPDAPPVVADDKSVVIEIDIRRISPNQNQPRKKFEPNSLIELRKSIQDVGVLSPIIVKKDGERYCIIAGERRFHAAKAAELKTIPCIIRDVTREEMLELAIIENVQREDLNDIELAYGYRQLKNEYYLTQNQIAEKVGKSRSVIANTLRLLELSQNLQEAVRTGEITSGHARALLSLNEDKRDMVLEIIREKSLSVRQVEAMVKKPNGNGPERPIATDESADIETPFTKSSATVSLDPDTMSLLRTIEETLRTKVEIRPAKRAGGGGKLVIHYYGDDDFNHIMSALAQLRGVVASGDGE
ncbi:ParB/RepB/Spo0J family partition protein [bacterium]|nr:ParB/RepB/Spo0J family partition protein [bacterium]